MTKGHCDSSSLLYSTAKMATVPTVSSEPQDEMVEVTVEQDPAEDIDVWALLKKKNDKPETVEDDADTEPPSPVYIPDDLQVKLEKLTSEGSLTGLLRCTDEECLGFSFV